MRLGMNPMNFACKRSKSWSPILLERCRSLLCQLQSKVLHFKPAFCIICKKSHTAKPSLMANSRLQRATPKPPVQQAPSWRKIISPLSCPVIEYWRQAINWVVMAAGYLSSNIYWILKRIMSIIKRLAPNHAKISSQPIVKFFYYEKPK